MPLSSRLGPSHAHNVETQTLQHYCTSGWKLAIDAKQPNVPLGSTFRTHVLYSVLQTGPGTTELQISGQLHFQRQGISMLRGTIESGWRKGTRKTYGAVEEMLKEAFSDGGGAGAGIAAVHGSHAANGRQVAVKV